MERIQITRQRYPALFAAYEIISTYDSEKPRGVVAYTLPTEPERCFLGGAPFKTDVQQVERVEEVLKRMDPDLR